MFVPPRNRGAFDPRERFGLVDLVVVADGMIKERHTSPERLIEAAAQWSGKGCPGGTQSRITRARRRGFATGDPAPPASGPRWPSGATCQCGHSWRDGSWRRRYDLAYEHLRLIIEYDGRQHAEDKRQQLTDIFRREELDQMHWRLVIITAEGIYREPLRTLQRVRDALLECGAVGVRRTYKPEWRLHFPGR